MLKVGKSVVFGGGMDMRKFRGAALPFSKVVCFTHSYYRGLLLGVTSSFTGPIRSSS